MFTVVFQQIILVIKLFFTKTTDFWSCWIIFWKTIVNFNDFYLLNLWKILLGGLGQSSRTVTTVNHTANLSWQTRVGKPKLGVRTAQKQAANTFANCWRQIETCLPTAFMPFTHTKDVTKTRNGEWGMGNGEQGMGYGKLKWEIENGKLNIFYTLTFYNVK